MDPDFDGIQNLLEFVLRNAPMTPSRAALPTLKQDAGQWVFEYDRNDGSQSPATSQGVQYGGGLTVVGDVTIPATTSGAVTATPGMPADHVRVVIPNSSGKVLARIKVTQ